MTRRLTTHQWQPIMTLQSSFGVSFWMSGSGLGFTTSPCCSARVEIDYSPSAGRGHVCPCGTSVPAWYGFEKFGLDRTEAHRSFTALAATAVDPILAALGATEMLGVLGVVVATPPLEWENLKGRL